MVSKFQTLLVVVAAFIQYTSADTLGKECYTNYDCPNGSSCVAGDSVNPVQRCVAGLPCGAQLGGCPGDEKSGQLTCIWRPDEDGCAKKPGSCTELNGEHGIYKCISMDRCDKYFKDACSGGCNVNGKQCNGRGSCQQVSEVGSKIPEFKCLCDSGWNGTKCDNVVDDSCMADVGQCGEHGTCSGDTCTCTDGYTGKQCQIPPKGSGSGTVIVPSPTPSRNNNNSASKASDANTNTPNKSKGSSWSIIIAIIAALVVVGAIIFVVIARKKKREQEANGAAFNRANSADAAGIVGGAPTTPKGKIVIM